MTKFVTLDMNAGSSTALIDALAGIDANRDVSFVFKDDNSRILNAYVDGAETPHQLVLCRNGSWCMRTCLEV